MTSRKNVYAPISVSAVGRYHNTPTFEFHMQSNYLFSLHPKYVYTVAVVVLDLTNFANGIKLDFASFDSTFYFMRFLQLFL